MTTEDQGPASVVQSPRPLRLLGGAAASVLVLCAVLLARDHGASGSGLSSTLVIVLWVLLIVASLLLLEAVSGLLARVATRWQIAPPDRGRGTSIQTPVRRSDASSSTTRRHSDTDGMRDAVPRGGEQPEARAILHDVDVAVADAEDDLDVVLLQPRLVDPSWSTTARFRAERARVRQLVASDPASWLATSRASELRTSWLSLKEEARRVGLHDRPWRQRRRIHRARRLLTYARGDGGSPAMRVRAYRQGLRLLDGVVTVPEPLRRSIYEAAALTPPPRMPGPDFPTYG